MDNKEISNLYFEWLCNFVMKDNRERMQYSKLLSSLFECSFYYIIPRDRNRMSDGLDLRYEFCESTGVDINDLEKALQNSNCNMLEMMVALSIRCETEIMYDPKIGEDYEKWFKEMLKSLKIDGMTDIYFNEQWVQYRLDCLLNRNYEYNGEGSLFTLNNPKENMQNVEIWYQMCLYLDELLEENN